MMEWWWGCIFSLSPPLCVFTHFSFCLLCWRAYTPCTRPCIKDLLAITQLRKNDICNGDKTEKQQSMVVPMYWVHLKEGFQFIFVNDLLLCLSVFAFPFQQQSSF
jgi:hypothetical protein